MRKVARFSSRLVLGAGPGEQPLVCYRDEAPWRERLTVAAATLCLALNLLCTGLSIYAVKLLRSAALPLAVAPVRRYG